MHGLQARRVGEAKHTKESVTGIVVLFEDDGPLVAVRCLCRTDDSTLIGKWDEATYQGFAAKYGDQVLWAMCRQVTLSSL
jgi:hypothetical protein